MPNAYADTSPGWFEAIRERRKALLQRVGMGATAALVFSPLLGWTFSMIWVAGYMVVQLLELWVFRPIATPGSSGLSRSRSIVGGAVLVLNATYFGSLSVPMWLTGGPMGGICTTLLLSAGAIYSVISAPRSTSVLLLTTVPQFLYLAATPLFMMVFVADRALITAATIAVGVYITFCFTTWKRMNAARVSEQAARVEADRKRADAERAMDSRSAFLAAVGHDLRTPISAIMAGSAELERIAQDGTARSHAVLISDAGLMMKALLDDLLDHAKLESGHMTVDVADFNLRQLLAQTLRLWQGPARAKGLKLRVEGAAQLPAMLRGDPMRLRQVLNNLISNAMKFTDAGSITLALRGWTDELGAHSVLIEVVDTGPGMSREQTQRLFTPFDQTAEGVAARYGGTGLGLAISKQLVELMGGRLTARSRVGQGSSFTLALTFGASDLAITPAAVIDRDSRDVVARALGEHRLSAATSISAPAPQPVVEPELATDATADQDGDDERPLRVLVVDDHDINRRAIQLILQPLGCDVATAADGMAALRICETAAFDVIFMDVRMPELDGRETTRRLRAGNGANAAVPVIAVTADTAPEDIAACNAAGMTYFVPKPITPAILLGALNHVLAGGDEVEEDQTVAA